MQSPRAFPITLCHAPGAKGHPLHLTSLLGQDAGLGLKEGQAAKTLLKPGSDDDTRREGREEGRERVKRKEGTGWERGGGRAERGEGKGGEGGGGERKRDLGWSPYSP